MFTNAEWYARLLHDSDKNGVHLTWLGDSTGGSGGSTSFCTDYNGALGSWTPPRGWGGCQLPDAAGTQPGIGTTNAITTTSTYGAGAVVGGAYNGGDGYANCFPGMTSPESNTDGRTVGYMTRWTFNANRATDGSMRLLKLPDQGLGDSWIKERPEWMRAALKARIFAIRHPRGPAEIRLYGIRNDARGTVSLMDLSIADTGATDEVILAFEADIAAGTGNAGLEVCGGSGNETDKDTVLGMPVIYRADKLGLIMDTISMGSWGVKAYGDAAGMSITSPSYTAKFSDAAIEQYLAASVISGTKRVLMFQVGQNDAALNESQFKTALSDAVARWKARATAAGVTLHGIILRSPPDPGYNGIVDSRFDGFDRTVESLANSLTTSAVPVMASQYRSILGNQRTVVGAFGTTALANGDQVHRSAAGAKDLERLWWRQFRERVYNPLFANSGGLSRGSR